MMGKDLGRDGNGEKMTHGGRSLIPEGTVRDGVNGPTGKDENAAAPSTGSVNIARKAYERMKKFCEARGWQVKFMGSKALNEWMDRIEAKEAREDEQV